MGSEYPEYDTMISKLKDSDGWDVRGIVSDASVRLLESGDEEAAAVIDSLAFAMREIDLLIRSGRRVDAKTLTQAAKISRRFVEDSTGRIAQDLVRPEQGNLPISRRITIEISHDQESLIKDAIRRGCDFRIDGGRVCVGEQTVLLESIDFRLAKG